ncbi:phosphatidylserine/phosphatidylglycerophosphate/cardiolipin synthase family protein [Bdellovibrio bacteriovorus]|uniref:phospholipase D-like domain-containing protein n=1 Tax=Bdellovibrio bacteriovorus TaxID=959 RepID=UPI0035A63AA4
MVAKKVEARIELVTDNDYLDVLLRLLGQARKEIDVMAYSFAIGSAAGKLNKSTAPFQIAQKLVDLKKEKLLNIRVFLEAVRSTSDRNFVTARFLEEAGIVVEFGATHAKGFCIDRAQVLFGSTNLTQQSIVKNYEANLLIDDKKVAKEFHRYFQHLWEGGGHGEVDLERPLLADGAFKDVLVGMINSARKSLEFSIYFFDHKEIRDAFIKAHERGVKIKGFGHYHTSFALGYVYRTRRTIETLRSAGIRELYFTPASFFAHSKYLIKDGREVLLGTGNWLKEDVEIHPQLSIYLENPKLSKELSKHLERQMARSSAAESQPRTL